MSSSLKPHLDAVKNILEQALCLQFLASPVVERHSKPEVEVQSLPGAILEPVIVSKSANEGVMLESSVNSARLSLKIKQADELEELLCHKFARFMMQRADNFSVLRRKPLPGYDLTFLITDRHLETYSQQKMVEFLVKFMEEIGRELSEMKIGVNERARMVAESFLKEFA